MAALSVLVCSQHRVLLVRMFLFLAVLHYTSSALTAVEYSLTSSPSSPVSVILINSFNVKRSRRSVDNDITTTPSSTQPPIVTKKIESTSQSTVKTTTTITTTTPKPTPKPTTQTSTKSTTTTTKPTTVTSTTSSHPATTLTSKIITTQVINTSTKPSTTTPTIITDSTTSTTPTTPTTTAPTSSTTPGLTTPLTKVIEDNHKYYQSKIIQDDLIHHWINMDEGVYRNHKVLSDNHRLAAPVNINFKFRFFGHTVVNLTIATGGFLYMSPFLHKWLTATQYIAPLMANFDTTIGKGSEIRILDTDKMFVVHWKNVHLHDQPGGDGSFNFQVILLRDGTIKFVYKKLPIAPHSISTNNHPVKIGLSDAYYIDKVGKAGIVRIIYEYHRVTIDKTKIRQRTVVILSPLPTCNLAEDCNTCFNQQSNFSCNWCSAVGRCSNGIDWHRQEWLSKKCVIAKSLNERVKCPAKPIPIAAIVIVLIVLVLCIALGAWCWHGYSHPTSPLGIWLMENRPSQMKAKMANMKFWKQSTPAGDKYRIESAA